jgi:GNAT superfamily N-acetyltransferase
VEGARPATPAELGRLAALLQAQQDELGPQRGGALWVAHHPAPTAARLATAHDDPEALVLSGTYDDVVVGVLTARLVQAPGYGVVARIDDLYVEPAAREVGVGAALMDALRTWALDHRCAGIDAVALPGARATKNFFEAHGLVARAITVHQRIAPTDEAPE